MSENNLKQLIGDHLGRYWPADDALVKKNRRIRRKKHQPGTGLKVIRLIPWVLLTFFVISFIWDFQGYGLILDQAAIYVNFEGARIFTILGYSGLNLPPFSRIFELEGLIITVSAAGLIGFFTNWLAITMLFHPRKPRPLLGHGIIPASRDRVADMIATAISKDLLSEEIIHERIHQSGVVQKYRDMAVQVTEGLLSDENFQREIKTLSSDFLKEKFESPELKEKLSTIVMDMIDSASTKGLAGVAVKVYQMLNREGLRQQVEDAIDSLPETADVIVEELARIIQTLPEKIAQRGDDIEGWLTRAIMSFVSTLDIYEIVSKNLREYDSRQFETLIKSASNDQLIYIKYLGGALGAVGGLVIFEQWLALPFLGLVMGAVVAIDYFVMWLISRRNLGT